ncbi:MAG: RluA family pseudouridine synthase [Acidimicrobiaceae bacterium]|nr:RluA family pseudouridine synthase [Acidimicrobiaceae bacterium]MYC42195.1 RluA family pseudouridine synthase [Acidimicrobiaceae bacterium]MYH87615.1 RluA family pseudouridine synthase [Acidimicrobiaceae bacterium]
MSNTKSAAFSDDDSSGRAALSNERALSEEIPFALADERLDRVVALMAEVSRSVAARMIDEGAVTIDGVVATSGSARVETGSTIEALVPVPTDPRPTADPAVEFRVVYEDPHILVVDKPADLVVHPGAGHKDSTLVNGLLSRYPEIASVGEPQRPGIVHRLDRTTSGLLVVARTSEAYGQLVVQMSAHEPERVYQALAWGHLEADRGTIDAPIGRSPRHPTRMAVIDRGRPARTHYEVVERFAEPRETSLLECRLETGRTHQIRVHLKAIGHPVVGDRAYDGHRPGIELDRPFLHACALRFRHPVTDERVELESPLAADLVGTLQLCSG